MREEVEKFIMAEKELMAEMMASIAKTGSGIDSEEAKAIMLTCNCVKAANSLLEIEADLIEKMDSALVRIEDRLRQMDYKMDDLRDEMSK